MSAQARPHLIARRLSADIVGSLMWANDLSAGFLARDAGKVASGPMVQTKRGIFLYAEITGLTCEKNQPPKFNLDTA